MPKALRFILSDESLNKYGFRVLNGGIDLAEFKKNPVMFYNHNRMNLPIGKWKNISLTDGKLVAEAEFDEDDELALKVKGKVEKDILNATSIGFDVLAISDDKAHLIKGQTRATVTKARLLEASIVDIPANGNAMKFNFTNGVQLSGDIPQSFLNAVLPTINHKPDMKKIAAKLGLAEDATEEQILSAIDKIEATEDNSKGIKALTILGEKKGFKKELIEKLAKADFDVTLQMIEDAKEPASEKNEDSADGGGSGKESSKDEVRMSDILAELKASLGGKEKKKEPVSLGKMEEAELKALLTEKPEEYQALFKAEYGYEPSLEELRRLA